MPRKPRTLPARRLPRSGARSPRRRVRRPCGLPRGRFPRSMRRSLRSTEPGRASGGRPCPEWRLDGPTRGGLPLQAPPSATASRSPESGRAARGTSATGRVPLASRRAAAPSHPARARIRLLSGPVGMTCGTRLSGRGFPMPGHLSPGYPSLSSGLRYGVRCLRPGGVRPVAPVPGMVPDSPPDRGGFADCLTAAPKADRFFACRATSAPFQASVRSAARSSPRSGLPFSYIPVSSVLPSFRLVRSSVRPIRPVRSSVRPVRERESRPVRPFCSAPQSRPDACSRPPPLSLPGGPPRAVARAPRSHGNKIPR
jgi:hypothetical protein